MPGRGSSNLTEVFGVQTGHMSEEPLKILSTSFSKEVLEKEPIQDAGQRMMGEDVCHRLQKDWTWRWAVARGRELTWHARGSGFHPQHWVRVHTHTRAHKHTCHTVGCCVASPVKSPVLPVQAQWDGFCVTCLCHMPTHVDCPFCLCGILDRQFSPSGCLRVLLPFP